MLALPLLAVIAGQTAPLPQPAPPPACAAPEHRQFDFWIGRWDVYPTGKDALVAHSLIEKLYAGCTVRENWMPLKGSGGGSLNMYDPADGIGIRPGTTARTHEWSSTASSRTV